MKVMHKIPKIIKIMYTLIMKGAKNDIKIIIGIVINNPYFK